MWAPALNMGIFGIYLSIYLSICLSMCLKESGSNSSHFDPFSIFRWITTTTLQLSLAKMYAIDPIPISGKYFSKGYPSSHNEIM